ncbi:hypothetical protein, partial [Paracoccus sp. (in: a-proteobacteria)]|uniref:hypothetical protein n=1 Tax=Paracoccus sp. TaxID=267 RepID=UPI00333F5B34
MAPYSTLMGDGKDETITANLFWGGQTTLKGGFFHESPLSGYHRDGRYDAVQEGWPLSHRLRQRL